MLSDHSALLARVESAFADVRHPGWEVAYHGHPEWTGVFSIRDFELLELERKIGPTSHWKDVDISLMRGSGVALLTTTPVAFPFFIAAMIWALLTQPDELDAGICSIARHLAEAESDRCTQLQIQALTSEQLQVVRDVVGVLLTEQRGGGLCCDPDELAQAWGYPVGYGEVVDEFDSDADASAGTDSPRMPCRSPGISNPVGSRSVVAIERPDLLARLERAFADVRHPGPDAELYGHPEWAKMYSSSSRDCEQLEHKWGITPQVHWRELDIALLRDSGSTLLASAPAAFPFYIAAMMWTLLRQPDELGVGVCALQHHLAMAEPGPGCCVEYQLSALSCDQLEIVREVVGVLLSKHRHRLCGDPDELARAWGYLIEDASIPTTHNPNPDASDG